MQWRRLCLENDEMKFLVRWETKGFLREAQYEGTRYKLKSEQWLRGAATDGVREALREKPRGMTSVAV